MISKEEVEKQLKKINFNPRGWGRGEVSELAHLLLPGEELEAAVNGYYDGGFALLVASKERVLLVDKKPLNNLKFEDLRFDMISEFDYGHSIMGASVSISSGYKTLNFTSTNQRRLRELLSYVQNRMCEVKHVQHEQRVAQQQHLEAMNRQLQKYLRQARRQQIEPQIQPPEPKLALPEVSSQASQDSQRQGQVIYDRDSFERAAAASIDVPDQTDQEVQASPSFANFAPRYEATAHRPGGGAVDKRLGAAAARATFGS